MKKYQVIVASSGFGLEQQLHAYAVQGWTLVPGSVVTLPIGSYFPGSGYSESKNLVAVMEQDA